MKNIRIRQQLKPLGFLIYTVVWVVLFLMYEQIWGDTTLPYKWLSLAIVSGYILLIVFQLISDEPTYKSMLMIIIIAFGVVILQILGLIKTVGHGDQGQLARNLMDGIVFPRWLGGSAILFYIHRLWTAIPIINVYANDFNVLTMFIKIAGASVMLLFSINLLNKWTNRMSVILPLAIPVYLMFSTGYDEYYPFVAGLFLFFLMTVLENEPTDQNVYWFGFLLAILTVFYLPFLPISLIALAYYCFFYRSLRLKLLFSFFFVCTLSVFLFWPSHNKDNYIKDLVYSLNTGNSNTKFLRYIGHSAGENSIFFELRYVLSSEHFKDLFYMFFWSGNLVSGILLATGIYYLLAKKIWKKFLTSPRIPVFAIILIWQVFYFMFMIPKRGPRIDIDLFFSFYILLAFISGQILDFAKNQIQLNFKVNEIVIPAVIANAVVMLFFLIVAGIP